MKSDQYYRELTNRRRATTLMAVILIATLGCLASFGFSVLHDGCTESFDRDPRSVVESYLRAFAIGDLPVIEGCWAKYAYDEVKSGCSEICIGRNIGSGFSIVGVELGTIVEVVETNRAQMEVEVWVACPSGTIEEGQVTLDSTRTDVPWRHWRLVSSTIGGTVPEPWCRE